ncbi:MAG: hypothetical protein K9N62_19545 [Verrucomicrobia bacterium]|nr:hypothetical protein [Verrucomicrobiota bacterium]
MRPSLDSFSARQVVQRIELLLVILCMGVFGAGSRVLAQSTPAYAEVDSLFAEHCLDCHGHEEPEAKLVLETHAGLTAGGESGALLSADADASLLVRYLEGRVEKDGKVRIMPPGKRKKLAPAQIAVIKDWIRGGAVPPPAGYVRIRTLDVPKIVPTASTPLPVHALAYEPSRNLFAVARHGVVDLVDADSRQILRTLKGHAGAVNRVVFAEQGRRLFAASGEPGVSGEVREWNTDDATLVRVLVGHTDAIYAMAISPDGSRLATGGYDQRILMWNLGTGTMERALTGHNGAIFGLAFRPDGRVLASASADRTIKLWNPVSGERLDTLSQPLKEQYAVAFRPDGRRLYAGGVDNRIRIYEISPEARETTNPLLEARFVHEGAILAIAVSADGASIATSADDRSVKLWKTEDFTERALLEPQPDWAPALVFGRDGKTLLAGRLDGSLGYYQTSDGSASKPPQPKLSRLEPRGVQRGVRTRLRLVGDHLSELKGVKSGDPRIKVELLPAAAAGARLRELNVFVPADMPRGAYEFSGTDADAKQAKVTLHVDALPQMAVGDLGPENALRTGQMPVDVWGVFDPGPGFHTIVFEGRTGETLVFDLRARELGSKASVHLTLTDSGGHPLGSAASFDGKPDPLLSHRFDADGQYRIELREETMAGSEEHFYRLTLGALPFVTDVYPLVVRDQESVQLVGYNLGAEAAVSVPSGTGRRREITVDPEQYWSRRKFPIVVESWAVTREQEPNDEPGTALGTPVPGSVAGRVDSDGPMDTDLVTFEAMQGKTYIVETEASALGSPIDTRIDLLNDRAEPVRRVRLQSVRDSSITFRAISSGAGGARLVNTDEMQLNDLLYMNGEVVKLFLAPRGPDSQWDFYTLNGGRRNYYDTSATSHALAEDCYIVRPLAPGENPAPNGLPVFPLYYENDDDSENSKGSDSRVTFTAPETGKYLVRISDTRGWQGPRFSYALTVREARPDFNVRISPDSLTVRPGTGQSFTVTRERTDGFEGEIEVVIENLPEGWIVSSPLIIEAGHERATGILFATDGSVEPDEEAWKSVRVRASAQVGDQRVVKEIGSLGRIHLGKPPELALELVPTVFTSTEISAEPSGVRVITVHPGETVPAWIRVTRQGHKDLVTFSVENLPHGVIVDNIGLNGVLLPAGETEREVFLTCDKWVAPMTRLCFARANQAGQPTSQPVLLRVLARE